MVPLDLATSCRAIAVRTVAVVVEENRNGRARRVSKKGENGVEAQGRKVAKERGVGSVEGIIGGASVPNSQQNYKL